MIKKLLPLREPTLQHTVYACMYCRRSFQSAALARYCGCIDAVTARKLTRKMYQTVAECIERESGTGICYVVHPSSRAIIGEAHGTMRSACAFISEEFIERNGEAFI